MLSHSNSENLILILQNSMDFSLLCPRELFRLQSSLCSYVYKFADGWSS